MESWFPIIIQYDTGEIFKCNSPSEIINGKSFRVLDTRYAAHDIKEAGQNGLTTTVCQNAADTKESGL
jgi:hypothetical protein